MGVEFIQRFFKLTLDNVYRFACSLMLWITVFSVSKGLSPFAGLRWVLDWLAVPSDWLLPVISWLDQRQEPIAFVAAFSMLVAILFSASKWLSRAGSTALLSLVILKQVGFGPQVLAVAFIVISTISLVSILALWVSRKLSLSSPEWVEKIWYGIAKIITSLGFSSFYLLSPLVWLISEDTFESKGTYFNPIYVERVRSSRPSGALGP